MYEPNRARFTDSPYEVTAQEASEARRKLWLRSEYLELRNSGDTKGNRDRLAWVEAELAKLDHVPTLSVDETNRLLGVDR